MSGNDIYKTGNKKQSPEILTPGVLLLMAAGACFVVANNYYNQPLLGEIAREFGISENMANKVATSTLAGYALGLFLLVPLGDKLRKKKIIVFDFILIILSLLCFAFSSNIIVMLLSGFFIGLSSVVPQMFVPLAAQLSAPGERSKNVGIVMTGLLVGIIGSRVFSGIIGGQYGWRSVFLIAAVIMLILWILVILFLPDVKPTFYGSYTKLMKSILSLIKERPDLRLAAFRGALSLASFQVFWTTLTFHLERPPFFAGSDVAGKLAIVGVAGALSALLVGRIADRTNKGLLLLFSGSCILASWVFFGLWGFTYAGLIAGIFIIDIGLQSLHITNQSIIFSKNQEATNRLNTVYMTCYFIGGSLGAFLAGKAWEILGWNGVVGLGTSFAVVLIMVELLSVKNKM